MPATPPKRQKGQGEGPRRVTGEILDVHTAAAFLGISEKATRARVNQGLLPFRKWGGKIIFVKSEIEKFIIATLPGTNLEQARANLAAREAASCE